MNNDTRGGLRRCTKNSATSLWYSLHPIRATRGKGGVRYSRGNKDWTPLIQLTDPVSNTIVRFKFSRVRNFDVHQETYIDSKLPMTHAWLPARQGPAKRSIVSRCQLMGPFRLFCSLNWVRFFGASPVVLHAYWLIIHWSRTVNSMNIIKPILASALHSWSAISICSPALASKCASRDSQPAPVLDLPDSSELTSRAIHEREFMGKTAACLRERDWLVARSCGGGNCGV